MGVTVYTFPTHNQERKREREMHGERKTSIKADSVHNLKRGSSSEEMPCCCCCCYVVVAVWVVCFGKVDDADAKMNWMAWLGLAHGNAHQANTVHESKKRKRS